VPASDGSWYRQIAGAQWPTHDWWANGFDTIWASGLEISAANAVPDANILTMKDYLEAASNINEAVSIPVIADCDTGYGNSNNVIRLVKKYEAAGIAAICIEDKCFPKVNSYIPGRQELAPLMEFVGKIMAAKDAQDSPEFMVIARVEALIAGWGLEEAWRRAEAYAEAGADAILIHKANP
jgi:phosphoenolpyruvate phosphomutase